MGVCVCVCAYVCVEWMGGKGSVHISYHLIFGFRGPPYLTQLSLLGQPPLPPKNHHSLSLSSCCISTHFHALFMCFIAFLVCFLLQKSWILWVISHFVDPPPITQLSITMPPPHRPLSLSDIFERSRGSLELHNVPPWPVQYLFEHVVVARKYTQQKLWFLDKHLKFYHLSMIIVS